MRITHTHYPAGPTQVPDSLGQPTLRYALHALAVLAGLFLFLAFYLGLLGATAFAFYVLVAHAFAVSGGVLFWGLFGAGAVSTLVVFVFLLKGLFKRQRADRSAYVEITEADEPRLFGFLRQLCEDTGAPMPHKVYLCPDVNAGVFYDSSLLSLVWPVKRNLIVGLGLVNATNLSEFKAVLAHEFGHFSQKTMRLSSYVYVVNNVLHHMVHGRDRWDEVMVEWRNSGTILSGVGWALSGTMWSIRKAMGACLQLINVLDAALSRQMEFHADSVAVRVTGSDAIVHALVRTEYGEQCFAQTRYDLRHAADHGLFTQDLFYHHSRAMKFMRIARRDPRLGRPPALPEDVNEQVRVFERDAHTVSSMWDSHPSNADREDNAKRHYIRSVIDERSPWALFEDPKAVRELVTGRLFAREIGEDVELSEPHVVQAFINDDHAEIIFDSRYEGMYENRFIEPGELEELVAEAQAEPRDRAALVREAEELWGDRLKRFMASFKARLAELQMLETVMGGHVQWGKTFVFRGEQYRSSEAQELFSRVYAEMEADRQWFSELDRQVFLTHWAVAREVGEEAVAEIEERYGFQLGVQSMIRELRSLQGPVNQVIAAVSSDGLDEAGVEFVFETLRQVYERYVALLKEAALWPVPTLNNVRAGTTLRDLLLTAEIVDGAPLYGDELDGSWLQAFCEQYGEVLERLSRVRRKSLGGILTFQERLVERLGA